MMISRSSTETVVRLAAVAQASRWRAYPMAKLLHHLEGRLLEWTMSGICIFLGTGMTLFPKMIHGSIVQILVAIMSPSQITAMFLTVGLLGTFALIANGASFKVGPRVRSFCAVWRSMIWFSFAISMTGVSFQQGFPSPMVFVFFPLALAETYVAYRAILDVRSD